MSRWLSTRNRPSQAARQLDLALFRLTADHVLLTAQGQQPLRRVIFVDHARSHLPDIQVLLAHAQQHGNIVLCDDVALAEPGVLILILDDLSHIVAQHVAHGLLCSDQLHFSTSISSPGLTTPSFTTTAKMPSVGMTHLPTAFLMAQSLWHSLPIWVTSTSVSPMRRWVPTGRCLRSMPVRIDILRENAGVQRDGATGPAWCRCFPPPIERSGGASLRRGRPPRCRGAVSIQFPERAFSVFPFSR